MHYDELIQPKFEIDFWLRHFKGLSFESSRAYENYLMQPRSNSMFFADNAEYFDEDYIDIIDNIQNYPIERTVELDCLDNSSMVSEETLEYIDPSNIHPGN